MIWEEASFPTITVQTGVSDYDATAHRSRVLGWQEKYQPCVQRLGHRSSTPSRRYVGCAHQFGIWTSRTLPNATTGSRGYRGGLSSVVPQDVVGGFTITPGGTEDAEAKKFYRA